MARREDVETAIWSDPDFLSLSAPGRLVYLWAFTNPRCNMAGIYQVPRQAIVMETGIRPASLEKVLPELERGEFLFYDGRVLFVRTRVKHLRSRSSTIARSIGTDLARLSDHPFTERWWSENEHFSWITGEIDRSSMGHGGPMNGSPGKGKGIKPLFIYWKERCNHPHAKLTSERQRRIRARLDEGYSEEQVRKAIDGAARAAFVNEQGKRFDDIELICRNGSKLESFMERAESKLHPLPNSPQARSNDFERDYEESA